MASLRTSILLPSAYRPQSLDRCLHMLYSTVDDNPIEVLISCVEDDIASIRVAKSYQPDRLYIRTVEEYGRGATWITNELGRLSSGDVVAIMADDLVPNEHWLTRCLTHLVVQDGGIVGFNDLSSDGTVYMAHGIVARSFLIEQMGGTVYPPQYFCWYGDREMSDKAQAIGLHTWARDAVVEHLHYSFGKAEIDRTYAEAIPHYKADQVLYETRKAQGFPIDYEAVL